MSTAPMKLSSVSTNPSPMYATTLLDLPAEVHLCILEMLGCEDPQSLLCCVRVCRVFSRLITMNGALQELLYFKPWSFLSSSLASRYSLQRPAKSEINPMLLKCFRSLFHWNWAMELHRQRRLEYEQHGRQPQHTTSGRALIKMFYRADIRMWPNQNQNLKPVDCEPVEFTRMPWAVSEASRTPFLRPEASWRRMLLSGQPTQYLRVVKSADSDTSTGRVSYILDIERWASSVASGGGGGGGGAAADGGSQHRSSPHFPYLTMGIYYDILLRDRAAQQYDDFYWTLFISGNSLQQMLLQWAWLQGREREELGDERYAVVYAISKTRSGNCYSGTSDPARWHPRPIGDPLEYFL